MVHLGHSWTTCLLMKTINTRNCRQKRYCSYLASGCPRGWPVRGRRSARGADSWGAECPGTMPSPPPVRWTSSACRIRSRSARTPAAPSAPPSYAALCWWRRPAQETKPWLKHCLGQQEWGIVMVSTSKIPWDFKTLMRTYPSVNLARNQPLRKFSGFMTLQIYPRSSGLFSIPVENMISTGVRVLQNII